SFPTRRSSDLGKPVVIVVAEVDAHTGNELAVFGQGNTGLECNLLELITCVVKQRVVGTVVRNQQVGTAVQIVVSHAYAHALPYVIPYTPTAWSHPRP